MTQSYIHKFTVMGLTFVRYPISKHPKDGTLGFVDNGVGGGWTDRDVAVFKNGEWLKPSGAKLRFAPAYWGELDGSNG